MRRRLDPGLVLAAGAALAAARPRWDGTLEDRVVAVGWVAALVLWGWLVSVGAVHAWATRTGRTRWRRLSGVLLPAAIRHRVEQLAVAGLLVVPVAACADDGAAAPAPVLVLEEAVPLEPTAPWEPRPTGPAEDAVTTTTEAPIEDPSSTTVAPPADAGAATTLAGGTTASTTASAAEAPPVGDAAGDGAGEVVPAPHEDQPAADAPPAPSEEVDPDGPDPAEDPAFVVPAEPGTRVVLRGDHLWSIAAEEVAAATGASPDREQVRRYWTALLEANRGSLASGDPDVIYPGEVVRLPAHQP